MKSLAFAAGVLLLAACTRQPSLTDVERDGRAALSAGDLQTAERHVDTGTRLADARHDTAWQRRFRVLRAEVLVGREKYAEAVALVDDVIPPGTADAVNVRLLIARGRARCFGGAAGAVELGEHDLEAAGALAATLPPSDLAATIALNLGNCAMFRHDTARAEHEFREAYASARGQKLVALEARAAGSLGRAATQDFRFDEAVTWLERARTVATTDGVRAKTLTNLGWCHYLLGDFERALSYLAESDALSQSIGDRGEQQRALEMTGNAYYRLHDLARAADAYRRSLLIAREMNKDQNTAELLSNLAMFARDQKQFDTARTLNAEALQIQTARKDAAAILHSRLTEALIDAAVGDAAGAEAAYRGILASPDADRDLILETRNALAQLRMLQGRAPEAEAEFQRAFEAMEQSAATMERPEHELSFYSSFDEYQDSYVDFLATSGNIPRALEVADRTRAHLLREKLEEGAPARALTAAQFRQAAGAMNAVILFYSLAPSRSFLWAVSRNGITLSYLPGEDEIAKHVDAYQRLLLRARDPLEESSADARWLYDNLVQPAQSAVPAGSRVVFVPDGALHQINPETLVAGAPAPHYWIEDVTLSIAPSISVLASAPRASTASAAARSILVIGDPLPAGAEFPKLAHASREVDRISDQFKPEARTVFRAAQADRRAYLESDPARYAYIHFAAHGTTNREAPLDSAVVLSPSDDAPKLYARDILRVPIRADLVTISACSGAGSRTYAGEGLVGLTWAFLTAGAKNVIAALWNVDDASTEAVMEELYARLTHGATPAEALRESKLALIKSSKAYRKPFYWAPFLTFTRSAPPASPSTLRASRH